MNALAEIVRAARPRGGDAVVTDRRHSLDAADVVEHATSFAREVRRLSTRASPVVAVVTPSSADAVTLLVAAVLDDFSICFLDPAADVQRRQEVLSAVEPDAVVDTDGLRPAPVTVDHGGHAGYIAMSSGSTGGGPKGVLSTWECLAAFVSHGARALDLGPSAHWAEPSHPAYDLAMTNLLLALSAGASLHVSGSLADRLRPLGFANRVGATHVRLAPRFIDLAVSEAQGEAAPSLRVWGSGGDRLSARHAARVLELGIPTLVNTYGTSETAGFASAARFTSYDDLDAVHGTVSIGHGEVGPWRAQLVSETIENEPASVLAVHSPNVGDGYLFGSSGGGYPRWKAECVVTGDLGDRAGDELFCLGRAGRLVKRSASFVNLDDLDHILRDSHGLTSFTVLTRGGSLVSLVEGEGDRLPHIRRVLSTVVTPEVLPDTLIPVIGLPRLGNGKVDHVRALRLAEESLQEA